MKKLIGLSLFAAMLLVVQSCKDSEDPDVKPVRGAFIKLNFELYNGTNPMVWDDIIAVDHMEEYRMELFKFYLSNIKIVTNQGASTLLKDVVILNAADADGMTLTYDAPQGVYEKLVMGIGLDSVLNASDPIQFADEHPLSAAQSMYWSWAAKYRFVRIDGRGKEFASDTTQILIAYHPGADEFYRTREFMKPFQLVDEDTTTINMKLDVAKWFAGPGGTIDIPTEHQSHTTPDDYPIALKFTDNFAASFELK